MSLPVLFDLLPCEHGKQIAVARLNKPEALNAIDLDMVNLLLIQLQAWQADKDVAMVVIDSQGDKAFCAGGDVVSMYHAMQQQAGGRNKAHQSSQSAIPAMLERFFSQEYRLDYLIHSYRKPILLWGNGIIMGGGLGLMAGASHRIVTETARIAMPEVSIGLFPDVGGSWFLNRMPEGCGRFLGTTGASIDAADALYVGLADFHIAHDKKAVLLDSLKSLQWQADENHNHRLVSDICANFCKSELPLGNVQTHQQLLSYLNKFESVEQYIAALEKIDSTDDKWISKAKVSVNYGSPITLHLVHQQMLRAAKLTLSECFQMELILACRCATFGEFQEGVRALLIDKDRQPSWAFKQVCDVDEETITGFFKSPWNENAHPLIDLGKP
jgi:enoyl-CoA hydratase/carnithine racemase